MILISHRGNINGRLDSWENHPTYITSALEKGYECEIDVWYENGEWYLGHDIPEHKVNHQFISNSKMWCHAKNIDSLNAMLMAGDIHCFWHENDKYTLTSKNYIWAFPGFDVPLGSKSICVVPERCNQSVVNFYGVCSDFIERYK
jgi:hypothetical protein